MSIKDISIRFKILGGILTPLLLTTALSVVYFSSIKELLGTTFWVDHTHRVINNARQIEKLVIDLETGERGFLLTGNEAFLEPYNDANREVHSLIAKTKELVGDNPPQVERLRVIQELVDKWLKDVSDPEIELRRSISNDAKNIYYLEELLGTGGLGKRLFDEMRKKLRLLESEFQSSNETKAHILVLNIAKDLVDMETGQRGFLITGKDEFLEPYQKGEYALKGHMRDLRSLMSSSPEIQKQIDKLELLFSTWKTKAAEHEISVRYEINKEKVRFSEIVDSVESGKGKEIVDSIRTKLLEFVEIEERLLIERETNASNDASSSLKLVFLGTSASLAVGVLLSVLIAGFFSKRLRILRGLVNSLARGSQLEVHEETGHDEIGVLLQSMNLVTESNNEILSAVQAVAKGDYSRVLEKRSEQDALVESINEMTSTLEHQRKRTENDEWMKDANIALLSILGEDQNEELLAERLLSFFAEYVNVQVGAFFVLDDNGALSLTASYAFSRRKNLSDNIAPGQGIVGQAISERKRIILSNVPDDYIVSSALGDSRPTYILAQPLIAGSEIKGAIELASLEPLTDQQIEFLETAAESIAMAFEASGNRERLRELLLESQQQSEEIQAQQEVTEANNELLQRQSEELREANEELEKRSESLERQKEIVEISKKELELSSKYKSEFLANMSHELRTPLNSLLILARALGENREGNLTQQQIKQAEVIYDGGQDLLNLINDILDLSKVEAGKLTLVVDHTPVDSVKRSMERQFAHVAREKNLDFSVDLESDIPKTLRTDSKRLEQIIKNLLSNAIKFTRKGSVKLVVKNVGPEHPAWSDKMVDGQTIAFSVIDTGIGIPKEKHAAIFEAFQQADGSTERKYGGTGLGLTISKELSRLLEGTLHLESEAGEGTTFTLLLPHQMSQAVNSVLESKEPVTSEIEDIPADTDEFILIAVDDRGFSTTLRELSQKHGLNSLVTSTGRDALKLVQKCKPVAILLDNSLRDMSGVEFLEKCVARVKTGFLR